jgi:hypothetical protein
MRRCLLFLLVLTMLPAIPCGAAMGAGAKAGYNQTTLEWLFNSRNDKYGNPHTRVYLVVGGQRYFVLSDGSQFSEVEREQYKDHGVPAAAVAACSSWWAGSGLEMYAIRRGRSLILYRRYLDEQSGTGRYQRFKVITLRR